MTDEELTQLCAAYSRVMGALDRNDQKLSDMDEPHERDLEKHSALELVAETIYKNIVNAVF